MTSLENILLNLKDIKVIDVSIPYSNYTALDLSIQNAELSQLNLCNATEFEAFVTSFSKRKQATVAYGGYNEMRNLYKRSTVFNDANTDERNIHIGIDLWIKAGTTVLAALDGKVHSFQYNNKLGDYGPTIILEHQVENHTFYTLYGHLSLESITTIKVGDLFTKGQKLATLGDAKVNGDYAPHLHFQIIKKIGHHFGDYPGVCNVKKLDFYLNNCPDPNLLLKIF